MPYKLTYFDFGGRAEISRLLFAAAGVEFEDNRISGEEWGAMKAKSIFGQMPLLEVDGQTFCQSIAIARFLARRFGLAGKSPLEEAKADMVIDCASDMTTPLLPVFTEKDEAKKIEIRDAYAKDKLPGFLKNLEKLLIMNQGGDGYMVGDSMTWADIGLIDMITWAEFTGIDVQLGDYPKLSELRIKVEGHPKIKAWKEKHQK